MSDATFNVTAVHGSREWNSQRGGPMVDYTIELDGLEGKHTLTQKPETKPPQVGDSLFGHAEDGGQWPSGDPKPPKFRKGQHPNGSGSFKSGEYSPEVQARIDAVGRVKGRCHSQDMALQYAAIRQAQGKLPEDFSLEDLFKIADRFVADAESAR